VTVLLARLVAASDAARATPSRRAKIAALAEAIADLELTDVAAGTTFLAGEPRQRPLGVGWAALRDLPAPAAGLANGPALTVADVDAAFDRLAAASGAGSQEQRRAQLRALFSRATQPEQSFLRALITGELRQGALEAVVTEALARASGRPVGDVRRALMLSGDLGLVASRARQRAQDCDVGPDGLRSIRLRVGTPVQPMLAAPAADIATAIDRTGEAAVEWKIDGVRVQVHRDGTDVAVFTRSLDDITGRVPDVVEAVLRLPATSAIWDGEAIALRPDGRPEPFQRTASRVGSRTDVDRLRATAPLTTYLFDLLHVDGEDLLDLPAADRFAALAGIVPSHQQVPRILTADPAEAAAFFEGALARGHEGVIAKDLAAAYEAGRRGRAWQKVKPRHTLDLVVLAAEWGHGRRRGWLSNLHLGARDPAGGFVMLGKTFKGLTDEMLAWQTERLLQLAVERNEWQVVVAPEMVVEIAFDGVQTSSRYPGGMALRFARVLRHRPDKRSGDADSVEAVRAIHLRSL